MRIDKNKEQITKIYLTYYNLFIAQGLQQVLHQILLIIFLKEFIKVNVNTDMMIKKSETCGIKCNYCDCFLEQINFKDDLIECKCLCCNNNYQQKFDEKLKECFFNRKFSNHDKNKFILLLQKSVYPYKYMDNGKNSMKHYYLKRKFSVT